jgi:hypothetical protein
MILAIIVGPIAAVTITECLRKRQDERNRKIFIFRTLMATRSAPLASSHIEALNLIEVEFQSSRRKEKSVLDCWRLYVTHLNDRNYPKELWQTKRGELLIDLLYAISVFLRYSYDKADIKNYAYYPVGYEDADFDNFQTRKLWLKILQGEQPFPVWAKVQRDKAVITEPVLNGVTEPALPKSDS